MRVLCVAVALLSAPAADAGTVAAWVKGGTLCGGTGSDPGEIGIGACAGTLQTPATYVTQKIIGMGISKTPLNNAANYASATMCASSQCEEVTAWGSTAYSDSSNSNSAYAETHAGILVGSLTAYATVGTSSYLAKGSGDYNYVKFKGYDASTSPATIGEAHICVTGTSTAAHDLTSCPKRTFAAGDYKFSLYGRTGGTGMAAKMASFPAFGFRQEVCGAGDASAPKIMLTTAGGDQTLQNVGVTPVTAIKFFNATADTVPVMTYTMRTDYYYGLVSGCSGSPMYCTATGSASVTILARQKANSNNCFYVDYMFPSGITGPDQWFVYDPTVVNTGSGSTSSATAAVPALVLTAAAAAAALV